MIGQRREVKIDPDLEPSQFTSNIMKRLILEYDSFFGGDHSNDMECYFLDHRERCFFAFLDSVGTIYGDVSKLNIKEMQEFAIMIPCLQSIYVCKDRRRQGIQREIFQRIIQLAEEEGELFMTFADPFILSTSRYESNAKQALAAFVDGGYKRPPNWTDLLIKQRNNFRSYGLMNFVWSEAQVTEPFQHWIYIPSTAPEDHRKIAESILRETPFPVINERLN